MTKHAKLSPSSASRWFNCPGSVELSKDIPNQLPNDAALKGTRLHEEAEKALRLILTDNFTAETVSPEIKCYLEYLQVEFKGKGKANPHFEVSLGDKESNCYGTADCVLEYCNYLEIVDFKTGNFPVDAKENLQLYTYALLASEMFGKVVKYVTIVQNDEIKRHQINTNDTGIIFALGEHINNIGKLAHKFKVGEWCRYCPAKYKCDEYRKTVSPIVKVLPAPTDCTNEELGKLLDIGEFLSGYSSSIKKEIERRMLKEGETIPGYKIVQGNGRRQWIDDEHEIIKQLKNNNLTSEQIMNTKLKSFTQIEKLNPETKELVEKLTIKQNGKYKIVNEFEKGDPVVITGDMLPAIED